MRLPQSLQRAMAAEAEAAREARAKVVIFMMMIVITVHSVSLQGVSSTISTFQ